MPRVRPTRITVTGHVVFDHHFGGCGDIYLYWRELSAGPADEGVPVRKSQPGYFSASIYDGQDWRKLQLSRLVPYPERAFKRTSQRAGVAKLLKGVVHGWRGEWAEYNEPSRTFRVLTCELS